jgi:chitodextrinase
VTQTGFALSWNAASDNVGVVAYDVYRNGVKVGSPTTTNLSQSGLVCGTSYALAVAARDAAGNTSSQAQLSVSTSACASPPAADTTPPSTPSGLTITGATGTTVALRWGASTDNVGVAGYRVYLNSAYSTTTAQLSATVSGLACGSTYVFQVDAFDLEGNASPRASVTAPTAACADTQAPSAPLNVAAASRTATSIALAWSASTDNVGVTGYGLYRAGAQVGTTSLTNAIFSGLACNTNYTLAVDASDAAGNRSSKTTVMVATTACPDTTPPSTPTGLAASNVTQTGLTLTWNASSDNVGVTGYDVYRGGTKMTSVTTLSSAQSGLACGTSYSFGVVARDAAGNSSGQVSLQVTTSACSAPLASWSGPITITQGGTYSGSWESTSSSTGAVRIATTEPVTITGRVRNLAGGPLIDAVGAGAVQVTVDRVFGYGGDTYQTSGRFFQAYDFKSVTIRNSTIENTRGIELTYGVAGSSVVITRNRQRNIQGHDDTTGGGDIAGNFVQFRVVVNSTIDVSWNEVVNEYNKSEPTDIISLYHTSNAKVHDNMLWHESKPGNAYNTSSQGGITIDCSDPGPGCDNNDIASNQLVDGLGTSIWGGSNNLTHDNRVVQDGYLPDGVTRIGNGAGGALYISPSGTNNHMQGNIVGYVNRDGVRDDFNLSPSEAANNTSLPGSITGATEQSEWSLWQQKVSANGISLGA